MRTRPHDDLAAPDMSTPSSDAPSGRAEPSSGSRGPLRFATARRVVEVAGPRRFLEAFDGEPRGMWARGPRWAAHAGLLESFTAGPGPDRFAEIEAAVQSRIGWWDRTDSLRVYGGFAFRDDHTPGDHWDTFPVALFHLPRVEIDGEGSGLARLRVRVLVRAGEEDVARARAESQADELVAQLSAVQGRPGPSAVPGTVREALRPEWEDAVRSVLGVIAGGTISKAVLARATDVRLASGISPVDLVHALWSQHTGTHAFFFEPESGTALLGAAPEAIATLRDGRVFATAVAGSVGVGESDDERNRLAESLLASAKDLQEHRIVVDDMVERMRPLADHVRAQLRPHVLTLSRIQHLETEIEALAPEGRSVLDLVAALHPTPAVCGVPRDAAAAVIESEEPFDRGWYAGPVGWFDTEGNGHFVPALRTAVGNGPDWRLYAGAGIVDGSDPASEWEETGIKFQPVLRGLEKCGARLTPDPG